MRPTVVVLGFVFGSAVAITFALVGTTIVFLTLRAEYSRLDGELGPLLISVCMFGLLTATAGSSFYGELKGCRWRRGALGGLLLMLATVAWYYGWPRP